MKRLRPLVVALIAVAVAPAVASPITVPPQVKQDVKQLVADLEGIAAHSDIDPADVQRLAADLNLFIAGASQPSADSVRKLASDAQAALADGKLSTTEAFAILGDLKAVLVSAGFTDAEIQQVETDVESIVTSSSVSQADFKLILSDLTALLADLQGTFLVSTEIIQLQPIAVAVLGAAFHPVAAESGGDTATIINALRAAIGAEASVAVNTSSLQTGNYTVNVTLKSTRSRMPLGALAVAGDEGKAGAGVAVFGPGGQALPAGLDVSDIGSVDISSENGAAPLLSGSTSDAQYVQAGSFELVPDTAAPSAKGNVVFQVKQQPSKTKDAFVLFARKLPRGAKLTLKVNGTALRNVKTDAKGFLLIASGKATLPLKGDGTPKSKVIALPASVDISAVQSVELDTLDGQVVATGGFAPK